MRRTQMGAPSKNRPEGRARRTRASARALAPGARPPARPAGDCSCSSRNFSGFVPSSCLLNLERKEVGTEVWQNREARWKLMAMQAARLTRVALSRVGSRSLSVAATEAVDPPFEFPEPAKDDFVGCVSRVRCGGSLGGWSRGLLCVDGGVLFCSVLFCLCVLATLWSV